MSQCALAPIPGAVSSTLTTLSYRKVLTIYETILMKLCRFLGRRIQVLHVPNSFVSVAVNVLDEKFLHPGFDLFVEEEFLLLV